MKNTKKMMVRKMKMVKRGMKAMKVKRVITREVVRQDI
jgi:hypothetical protein